MTYATDIIAGALERLSVTRGDDHHFSKDDTWMVATALREYATQLDNAADEAVKIDGGKNVVLALSRKMSRCHDLATLIENSQHLLVHRAGSEL